MVRQQLNLNCISKSDAILFLSTSARDLSHINLITHFPLVNGFSLEAMLTYMGIVFYFLRREHGSVIFFPSRYGGALVDLLTMSKLNGKVLGATVS